MSALSSLARSRLRGLVVEAWEAGLFRACVSNALAYEYVEVMAARFAPRRWELLEPVVGALLQRAEFVPVHFTWRPSSPDPGDEHVVDCAMNAAAPLVTFNRRDFRRAEGELGMPVWTPVDLLQRLSRDER